MEGRHWFGLATIAIILIVLVAAGKSLFSSRPSAPSGSGTTTTASNSPPPGAIAISIASSNTKQDWLHQAVKTFNDASKNDKNLQADGRPVFVEIIQEMIDGKPVDYRSGTMVSDTLKGKIKPTILSPGEETWLEKFKKEWQVLNNSVAVRSDAPVLVRTPIAVAMWQSRAKAMNCWPNSGPNCTWERFRSMIANPEGWKALGHPEWGKVKFGYGYFGESNSGTLGVISMCMSGAKKTKGLLFSDVGPDNGCGKLIREIEKAKVHSGKSDIWLLEKMINGGPEYLDAVITYESNVILMNRKHAQDLREPLVSVYPQDGTVIVGHPLGVLDSVPWVTPEQATAAKVFGRFLMSAEQQEAVLALGLRPADSNTKLGPPIEQSFGADPRAKLSTLELPEQLVIDRIGEVWRKVKKHSIIALVFDKSGSMKGQKITAAIKGAEEFVNFMDPQDKLMWLPFDSTIYGIVIQGYKSEIGEKLIQDYIRPTTAGGGTLLYDAVIYAYKEMTELRKTYGDAVRYGIVVLSDGKDEGSRNNLSNIQERLRQSESDPSGIQIHTICIGSDCDEGALKKVAAAAHGKFSKGNTAADMVRIYKDVAAHY